MGCDIHIVLERKNTDTGEWVGVRDYRGFSAKLLDIERGEGTYEYAWFTLCLRDYSFFNDLCGVRGSGSSFGFYARGLPEDASALSLMRLSADDPDLHSHSWLDMKQLSGPLAANKAPEGDVPTLVMERMGNSGYNLGLLREWVDDEIEDGTIDEWRLVFAFDN